MKPILLLAFVLLCPRDGWAQTSPDNVFRASLVAAVVAHSADLSETQNCLGSGRCKEANPWLARFKSPSGFAVAKMTVASLSLWGTAKLHESHPRWAIAVNVAQAVGFSVIAARNARVSK